MKSFLILSVAAILGATAAIAVERGNRPLLLHAQLRVQDAKDSLSKSNDSNNPEFDAHRAKALELLNAAQREIQAAADTRRGSF